MASDNTLDMAPTQVAQMPGFVKYRWWQRPSDGVIFETHVAEHVLRLLRDGWREVDGPNATVAATTPTPEAAVRYRYFAQPTGNLVVETASDERAAQLLAAGWSEMDALPPAAPTVAAPVAQPPATQPQTKPTAGNKRG